MTTGTSSGVVRHTCLAVDYIGDKQYRCQDLADDYSQPGDSGSPVFTVTSGNDVELKGIHWGQTTYESTAYAVFSAMGNIQATGELGTMTNCATGYSC